MAGAVLILLALFVVGPIGLFVVGAIWSALAAWMLSEDAFDHANAPAEAEAA